MAKKAKAISVPVVEFTLHLGERPIEDTMMERLNSIRGSWADMPDAETLTVVIPPELIGKPEEWSNDIVRVIWSAGLDLEAVSDAISEANEQEECVKFATELKSRT
jgi:hypothetical protein